MGKDTFEHNSIFGWMNMLKRRDNRFILESGERPPYPIIIDSPNFLDVVYNVNMADFGVLLFFTGIGNNNILFLLIKYLKRIIININKFLQ